MSTSFVMKAFIRSAMLIALLPVALFAQPQTRPNNTRELYLLTDDIKKKVIDTAKGHIGVALLGMEYGDSYSIGGNERFPMHSVFKFPLAIMILHMVDKGMLSLDQKIHVPKDSLDANTWSPMVKDFPGQDIDITIKDLLTYTVSKSDNNGCDILFRVAGGTAEVNKYIHDAGIAGMTIAATEAEMHAAWKVQYTNWCQPTAMVQLLQQFYRGKLLSKTSNDFLMKIMTESENSDNRIKGLLPPGTIVAHKTGSSGTNSQGISGATNDLGIVTMPNGGHYAIVIYVSDYKGGEEKGEHIIAVISKMIWDVMTKE
jgi:beta-lactamase class A